MIERTDLHIAIIGPCNPYELREFITNTEDVININNQASAPTTYIKELIREGYHLTVFSCYPDSTDDTIIYRGNNFELIFVAKSSILKGCGIPFRIHRLKREVNKRIGSIDILHAQWTYEYAYVASSFSRQLPVFCTVRDWCPRIMELVKGFRCRLLWKLNSIIFKKVMNDNNIHFIANSSYTYNCIISDYPTKEVAIIPNPINNEYVLDHKKQEITNPTFISIAQDVDNMLKNNIMLLRAFAIFRGKHPEAKLKMIGAYRENSEMMTIAKKENLLNGVELLGSKGHDELFNVIDQCTCLVHPSLEETFGNILLEAMARKVLCIGGERSGAVPYILEYGKCGILCNVNDATSIALAMEKSLDKKNANIIIENATTMMNELYRSDVNMQKTIEVYCKYL